MEEVPYLGHTIRRWNIGRSTFFAWPEAGARLMHWSVDRGDDSVREVIYWPELNSIENIVKVRGGNPILFPFCARVFDQGDIHFWRDAEGTRRPMPMHGIARQGRFRLVQINAQGFDATLTPDADAQAAYPYDYEFTVCYRFSAFSLACEFKLTNHGPAPIPWSAGHHFYFAVPWIEGTTRDDYGLQLPAQRIARQDEKGQLVPGPTLPRLPKLSHPDLVDALHLQLREPGCSFGPRDSSERIRIKLGSGGTVSPEATIVTWAPDANTPYYCVEPWMGPPNAPEHKIGLHWVPPGQSQRFCVEIHIE
jgi:galactose mutarotase-like enzyme